MKGITGIRIVFLFLALSALTGCATYYSHYAAFPAVNSAGDERQVRLSWQSVEYPGWWVASDKATPVLVETQCSDRVWKLTDKSHADWPERGDCGPGIRACGEAGQDLIGDSRVSASADTVCMAIQPGKPTEHIVGLERDVALNVYCAGVEGAYLRHSVVPYVTSVRKAVRGTPASYQPPFDTRPCKDE